MNENLFDDSVLSALSITANKPAIKAAMSNYLKQRQVVIDLIVSDLQTSDSSIADLFSKNMSIEKHVTAKLQSLGKPIPSNEITASIQAFN